MLLRETGSRRNPRTNHVVFYRGVLELTGCENIETTVHRGKLLKAGRVVCPDVKRLDRQWMCGELEKPPPMEGKEERVVS